MAWIAERFKDWTDSTGVPDDAVDRDAGNDEGDVSIRRQGSFARAPARCADLGSR
ncbi:hypothetical protein OG512_42005 [Streptomyces sp. NBC_01378]|uniref:hypothetical protein n=1 Tax=Streptomyces sp. NBC_01378 TaxID=2903844 RepID=UPI00324B602F